MSGRKSVDAEEVELNIPSSDPVFMRPMLDGSSRYQIIITHPRLPDRGLLIVEGLNERQAQEAVTNLTVNLDVENDRRISEDEYKNYLECVKKRHFLIEASIPSNPGDAPRMTFDEFCGSVPQDSLEKMRDINGTATGSSTFVTPASSAQNTPRDPPIVTGVAAAQPSTQNTPNPPIVTGVSVLQPGGSSSSTNIPFVQPLVEEDVEGEEDCPICMEQIPAHEAVMRCESTPCHYFHRQCLVQWIEQCQNSGRQDANCPICRQGLRLHAGRINDYLNSPESADLSEDNRTFLQKLLAKLDSESWSEVCTMDNFMHYGGMGVSAAWGFYNGMNGNSTIFLPDSLASRSIQIANLVGYGAGMIYRLGSKKREDDRRRNRSESGSSLS